MAIARTEVFASPPGVATAFAREAAPSLPPELADHRQALLAIERTGGYMHGLEREVWGTRGPAGAGRDRARRADAGRHRSPSRRWSTAPTVTGRSRWPASPSSGDRLWSVDNGLFWVVAALVRMVADDDLGDFWARARVAGARPRLAVHGDVDERLGGVLALAAG